MEAAAAEAHVRRTPTSIFLLHALVTAPQTGIGDLGVLRFQVEAELSVSDLSLLLQCTETLYGVTASFYTAGRFLNSDYDDPVRIIGRNEVAAVIRFLAMGWPRSLAPDPFSFTDPEILSRAYRGTLHLGSSDHYFEYASERQSFLSLMRLGLYRAIPYTELQVRSIRLNSPGPISLAGLGEPLKQVRELIKDLAFRNKQEKELGELMVEETRLKVEQLRRQNELGVGEPVVDRATVLIANSIAGIAQLGAKRRLSLPRSPEDDE